MSSKASGLTTYSPVLTRKSYCGFSSIRLDNYMYTKESFAQAYSLLEPGGRLIVFHMSVHQYIAERIFHLLTETAGRRPLGVFYQDHTLFNYAFIQGEGLPQSAAPPGDVRADPPLHRGQRGPRQRDAETAQRA